MPYVGPHKLILFVRQEVNRMVIKDFVPLDFNVFVAHLLLTHLSLKAFYMRIFILLTLVACLSSLTISQTKWKGRDPLAQMSECEDINTSWQWLSPSPQGNNLRESQVIDSANFVVVGDAATFLRSTNSGMTWHVSHFVAGLNTTLRAVWFTSVNNGFVGGDDGVLLKTSDAGESWSTIMRGTVGSFSDIGFFDSSVGVAILDKGTHGDLFRTTDGGLNWIHQGQIPGKRVWCSDNIAYAVGDSFAVSTDRGIMWQTRYSVGGESISFMNVDTGIVIGPGGLRRTTDRGFHWDSTNIVPEINNPPLVLISASLSSTGQGALISYRIVLGISTTPFVSGYVSSDAGRKWSGPRPTLNFPNFRGRINAGRITSGMRALAVGDGGGIFHSADAGVTWSGVTSTYHNSLNSISFVDSLYGVSCGYSTVSATSDGGVTWEVTKESIPTRPANPTDFRSVSYAGRNTVFVVGTSNIGLTITTERFLKSTNNGRNWIPISDQVDNNLLCVYMIDSLRGFVAGKGGYVSRTGNGWRTWPGTVLPSGTTKAIRQLAFVNSERGVAVGDSGLVLTTTNGGTNWFAHSSGTMRSLNGVIAENETDWISVGDSGTIVATTNAGVTWRLSNVGVGSNLLSIVHIFSTKCLAVGSHGMILATSDHGVSWIRQNTPTLNDLNDVCVVNTGQSYTVYAAGDNGTVLVSATSPLNPRVWTWGGMVDSSWHHPYNWIPEGLPLPGDSVIIGNSPHPPIVDSAQQQITVGSLNVLSGGRLTITSALPRLVVLGDITLSGTMKMRPPAATTIVVGGSWRILSAVGNDSGFIPSSTTVYFTGSGTFEKNFHNVVVDTGATMRSSGNIVVANQMNLLSDIALRPRDTLSLISQYGQSLIGNGKVLRGTIKRYVGENAIFRYRFESESTYVSFRAGGFRPSAIRLTTYPDTLPTDFGTNWMRVGGRVNVQSHSIRVDSVQLLADRRWAIRIPRGTLRPALGDSTFVRRVYAMSVIGDTASYGALSLRYETSEISAGVPEDSLQIYQLDILNAITHHEKNGAESYELFQNYPNPFNPTTFIQYQLPFESRVTLKVFNLLGQEVKTLLNEDQPAGHRSIQWSGTNNAGTDVGSGIYFLQMKATPTNAGLGSTLRVNKMLLVR